MPVNESALNYQKAERKKILEEMLRANERFSEGAERKVEEYAIQFVGLCNKAEFEHAHAIWSYRWEKDNLDLCEEEYYDYLAELEDDSDGESEKLKRIWEHKTKVVKSLTQAYQDGIAYFLCIEQEGQVEAESQEFEA